MFFNLDIENDSSDLAFDAEEIFTHLGQFKNVEIEHAVYTELYSKIVSDPENYQVSSIEQVVMMINQILVNRTSCPELYRQTVTTLDNWRDILNEIEEYISLEKSACTDYLSITEVKRWERVWRLINYCTSPISGKTPQKLLERSFNIEVNLPRTDVVEVTFETVVLKEIVPALRPYIPNSSEERSLRFRCNIDETKKSVIFVPFPVTAEFSAAMKRYWGHKEDVEFYSVDPDVIANNSEIFANMRRYTLEDAGALLDGLRKAVFRRTELDVIAAMQLYRQQELLLSRIHYCFLIVAVINRGKRLVFSKTASADNPYYNDHEPAIPLQMEIEGGSSEPKQRVMMIVD